MGIISLTTHTHVLGQQLIPRSSCRKAFLTWLDVVQAVLGNLLANAARHSAESSVIRVNAVREELHVAFSVADEGGGIPAESLPHLFRKFSRTQSEEQGGDTGLGLAICKGIVEAHGGRIWAESDGPGLGGAVHLHPAHGERDRERNCRFHPAPLAALLAERKGRTGKGAGGGRRPQGPSYVQDTLIAAGYAPVVTGDPEETLHLVAEERPALVLLDLVLPGTDGIELKEEILDVADVPVIFLSAYGRDELIATAFGMGAVDYVVKPFSPTELTARIAAALRRREVPETLEPYVLDDLTIDYAGRRVTLAGRPVRLLPMEYRMLVELSAGAGRVLTYEHLLDRVGGRRAEATCGPCAPSCAGCGSSWATTRPTPRTSSPSAMSATGCPRGRGWARGRRLTNDESWRPFSRSAPKSGSGSPASSTSGFASEQHHDWGTFPGCKRLT